MFQVGDLVTLDMPDNPRVHEQPGEVKAITHYGAVVRTPATAAGEIRALPEEMRPFHQPTQAAVAYTESHAGLAWGQAGYTGGICQQCGGCRMVRSGSCSTCIECGTTSGCS